MIIKTITCHDVYNLGASLQAYALAEYLIQTGNDVQIIDYKPVYLSSHYPLWGRVSPAYDRAFVRTLYCMAKLPGRLKNRLGKRKREFDKFKKEYLPCTERRYASFRELKEEPPYADVYFAGSDQIWNSIFPNGRDPAFYLQFAPEKAIKASYAASFATDEVKPEYRNRIQSWLNDLDFISVRELSGISLLNEMQISRGVQAVDPVFLLERTDWDKLCQPLKIKKPYILVYDFEQTPQIEEFAKKMRQREKIPVYSLRPCNYCDRYLRNIGPRTFLTLIKNAELVISNSFHATAFSIIFEKNFWVFPRKENINMRMRDLLAMVGLENRYVIEQKTAGDNNIDFSANKDMLDQKIIESKEFISTVLKSASMKKNHC